MKCTARARRAMTVCALVLWPGQLIAQERAGTVLADTTARAAHDAPSQRRYLLIGAGAVTVATFNQALAMPHEWKRTWHGYSARLGDQVGFAVAEESLRLSLLRVMPWTSAPKPCPSAKPGRAMLKRVGSAFRCSAVQTLTAYTPDGERRPNVPLLGAIAGASALSVAWRPERSSYPKAPLFALQRFGIVTWSFTARGTLDQLRR